MLIILGLLVLVQVLASETFVLTFGFLLLVNITFPEVHFHVGRSYFGILIGLILVSQAILATAVWSDFKERIWSDDIKRDLWSRIFSFGCFNYGYAMFNIIYFLIVIKGNMESGWWGKKRMESSLFKAITNNKVLNLLSKINMITVPVFLLSLLLVFIGGGLQSFIIGDLGFILAAIWFIAILNLGGIFEFLIMVHIVSNKWEDESFENYFTKRMFFLPSIVLTEYYNEVVKKEATK